MNLTNPFHPASISACSRRLFRRASLPVVLTLMAAFVAHDALALTQVTAFGSTLNVPSTTAAGTVLSRHTIPKNQLCGALAKCDVYAISLWPNGGGAFAPGPDIATNVPGISARLLIGGQPATRADYGSAGMPITISSSLEVQLVRDSRPLEPGSLAGQTGGNPSYFYICTSPRGTSTSYCGSSYDGLAIALAAKVKLVNGTCGTPTQSITLPGAAAAQFKGVGSTGNNASTQSFNLRFENCPPGYTRIGYTLTPIGGASSTIPGALPLRGGSTAKGIAIRITDASGLPAAFDSSLRLGAYSSSTGGTYTLPMVAGYVQTEAVVTPGTVMGAMSVLVDYQ